MGGKLEQQLEKKQPDIVTESSSVSVRVFQTNA